jgi:hypothetical protein
MKHALEASDGLVHAVRQRRHTQAQLRHPREFGGREPAQLQDRRGPACRQRPQKGLTWTASRRSRPPESRLVIGGVTTRSPRHGVHVQAVRGLRGDQSQAVMFCEVVEILNVEGGQREVVG